MKRFWSVNSGSYKIEPDSLYKFLHEKGFHTFKPNNGEPILVRIWKNRITHVTHKFVRKYCSEYIHNLYEFSEDENKTQVVNEFIRSGTLFSKDNLLLLHETLIEEIRDNDDTSYMFFQDCILKVTSESVVKMPYGGLTGQVWETDIIPFDLSIDVPDILEPGGEFFEFFEDITGHHLDEVEAQNRDSLTTIIGYLLHRYKNPANAKAIVLMDPYLDGDPQGGTGKGLFAHALGKVRTAAYLDGKFYRSNDKFSLSNVVYGTRVITFDDVPKDFDFEKIFPLITEHAVVERKYENRVTIPFEDSPKVLITTNYTVEGKGSSHRRRKIEFILSDEYDDEWTPEDRFGHLLFLEWDEAEWRKFYLFMAYCLQMYLLEGIVQPKFNVAERALKINASAEFISYIHNNIETGKKHNKKEVFEKFLSNFPDHVKIEQNTFTRWLKLYAEAYSMTITESHSDSDSFFELN
jgi:hypothetical protein